MKTTGPNFDQITNHIYIGGRLRPDDWTVFQALGVTVNIDLQEEAQDVFDRHRPEVYLWLPVVDWAGPKPATIHTGVRFMRQMIDEGRRIYVHCFAGVGRSAIMVAGYVVSTGMQPREALAFIGQKRPAINPNEQQISYLQTFAREWQAARSD